MLYLMSCVKEPYPILEFYYLLKVFQTQDVVFNTPVLVILTRNTKGMRGEKETGSGTNSDLALGFFYFNQCCKHITGIAVFLVGL